MIESAGVRGVIVRLADSWQNVLARHGYPAAVRDLLGEALAASVLMSVQLKLSGSLILQLQGNGPVHTVVAQATTDRTLRGLARWHEPVSGTSLVERVGDGHLALTLDRHGGERYQGIVALEGGDLAGTISGYFRQSEQLTTDLWLAADDHVAAGLMLQEIPGRTLPAEDWRRVDLLAATVSRGELLALPQRELLFRLFNEEQVRLYEPEAVRFHCSCSREKIDATLLALGRAEMDEILADQGRVEVSCEYCNAHYQYAPLDIERLFRAPSQPPVNGIIH